MIFNIFNLADIQGIGVAVAAAAVLVDTLVSDGQVHCAVKIVRGDG